MEKSRLSRLIEELGLAAAKPAHTEERPEAHTPEVSNADVEGALELSSSEDLEAPITESFSEWSRKRALNEYNPYLQTKRSLDNVDKGGFRAMDQGDRESWVKTRVGNIDPDKIPYEKRDTIARNIAAATRDERPLVSKMDSTKTGNVFRVGEMKPGFLGGKKFVDAKGFQPVSFITDENPRGTGGAKEMVGTVLTSEDPKRNFRPVKPLYGFKKEEKPAQAPQPAAAAATTPAAPRSQPQPAAQRQQSQQPTPREGSNRP